MLSIFIGMSADTFLCAIFSFCKGAGFFIVLCKNGVTVELATINISVFLFFFRGHWNENRQGNKFRDNIVGVSDTAWLVV